MALSPLRNLLSLPAPLRARLRADPAEQTWECPRCGIIEPLALAGGYLRRRCPCAQATQEAEQQRSQQAVVTVARAASTFRWLGKEWAEAEVASRTFATFELERHPEAFAQAQQFALHPRGTLLLHGTWDTGKTHLLAAIANAVNARGGACLFASTVSLFDAISVGRTDHRIPKPGAKRRTCPARSSGTRENSSGGERVTAGILWYCSV
jgi:hypothetical protein